MSNARVLIIYYMRTICNPICQVTVQNKYSIYKDDLFLVCALFMAALCGTFVIKTFVIKTNHNKDNMKH